MIQEQIDRITANIKNALTATAGKGVTVPENAKSDDLPGLIDQIELGVKLPTLTTPAADAEVFEGKEYIKQDGSAGTGAFTLTDEISAQETLINTLLSVLDGKAAVSAPEMKIAYVYRNSSKTYAIIFSEGATWQDFIDSKYNTFASKWNVTSPILTVYNNWVVEGSSSDFVVSTTGSSILDAVKPTDTITDGQIYQFFYVD